MGSDLGGDGLGFIDDWCWILIFRLEWFEDDDVENGEV